MNGWQWQRHRNLLAGFLVFSSVILFLVGMIVMFQKKGMFELRYSINAIFDSGIGLREGADVLFNGVKIGRVENMSLFRDSGQATGRVVLHLTVDRKYQGFITNYSVAFALRDKNLVSDRVVNIETLKPGGIMLNPDDTVRVTDSRDIETVLSGLTKLMGKMDVLINNIEELVHLSRSPNSTVGALLGSRELYDDLLKGVRNIDNAVGEGRHVMARVNNLGDTLHVSMTGLLKRADTTAYLLTRTAEQAERLSSHANKLADKGEVVLSRLDDLLKDGTGKMEEAGDLVQATSSMWPFKNRLPAEPKEFPLLLNEAMP
jgi:phospholipid/cholesterol/gamma-HCH transport system substrate-binding protein